MGGDHRGDHRGGNVKVPLARSCFPRGNLVFVTEGGSRGGRENKKKRILRKVISIRDDLASAT